MDLIKVEYPNGQGTADGRLKVKPGTVMGVDFRKVNGFFGSKEIRVSVQYAIGEGEKTTLRSTRKLNMTFKYAGWRNKAFEVLQNMDPLEIARRIIDEKTLHIAITNQRSSVSKQRKEYVPFKPSGNVTKQRKVQPS